MDELSDNLVERFYDPKVRRKIMVEEMAALLVEVLRDINNQPFATVDGLKRFKNRLELDLLKFARQNHGWDERELPLKITLDFIEGKPHADLEGPLAYEVGIAMGEFLTLGQRMALPGEDEKPKKAPPPKDGGFKYGV